MKPKSHFCGPCERDYTATHLSKNVQLRKFGEKQSRNLVRFFVQQNTIP